MAKHERHRQGAVRACFFVLIASVIVFAVPGVISFRRQRESIQSLIRSNLLLAGKISDGDAVRVSAGDGGLLINGELAEAA